jgi:hypothetical protein
MRSNGIVTKLRHHSMATTGPSTCQGIVKPGLLKFWHPPGAKKPLTRIRPGHHALELRVVAENHQTELEATDSIQFVIK